MRFPIRTAVALTLLLAASCPAHARLGETLAECTARYGPPRASLPSIVAESDPEAARFESGPLSIIVHFQKGTAWHISYAQGYLSDPDRHRLLKENSEKGEWQPRNGELSGNVFLWNNLDAHRVGCGINRSSLNTLEIMTRACVDAFARARARRIEAAALTVSGTATQ